MMDLTTRKSQGGNGGSLLNRPFSDVWGLDPFRMFQNSAAVAGIEINRTESGYTVEIPVAGFKPEHIEVTLEDGLLTVKGKNEKRQFTRSFTVPEEVDAERIEAQVADGLLTITLNLLPKAQPKRIEIKST
jgi:HSP20 family molecular chaperone IbpA